MLCELAHNFPRRIADLLERDRGLKRNFREETVTDLLMASLVGLESFGIRVDFPDEPTTGGDMEWIYAAPLEINGGRYLRLVLQAKRSQYARLKEGGYWFYQHLDHGPPPGHQAQTLMQHAANSPDGKQTLPLYIFYHPTSALSQAKGSTPAIEGINIVFASSIAPIVKGGCSRKMKRVDYWRSEFLQLSDLLCWPLIVGPRTAPPPAEATEFLLGPNIVHLPPLTGTFHPDVVASRLQGRSEQTRRRRATGKADESSISIAPVDGIPEDIRRAIDNKESVEDRKKLERPRVIFTTGLTREDVNFSSVMEVARSRNPLG